MGLAPRTRTRLAAAVLAVPLLGAPAVLVAAPAGAQAGADVKALGSNRFDPATITVPAGTTVTWTNEDGFHTVTGGDGQADPASPVGKSTLAEAGATARVTFDKPGTYPYFCEPHQSLGMKGEVVVTAAGAGSGSAAPASVDPSALPRPDANPSDADPAQVDPGGAQASESAGPGEENAGDEEDHEGVPGSTAKDNLTLEDIEDQRVAKSKQLGGYGGLLAAGSLALLALCVAVFASTRPRRPSA